MNLPNYILFNCSNTSITTWKVTNYNHQNFVVYSTITSGNQTLSCQPLSHNCATPTLLKNTNVVSPSTINFLTNDLLLAIWGDREKASISNILGYGAFLNLNGTIDGNIFTFGTPSFHSLASAQNLQGGIDLVWVETSVSNNSLIGYHFSRTNYNAAYNINITQTDAGGLLFPDIINLDNGSTMVTWQQRVPTNDWNIYAQIYSYNFSNPQNSFLVNKNTTDFQGRPSIASTNNTILIAWHSIGQIDSYDIFFKILDANGTMILDETLANNYTIGVQSIPKTAGTYGVYGITWTSALQDGDQGGVYGQLVYSNGTKIGTEFRINTKTVGNQRNPQVWVDGYNLIFGWLGPDDTGKDILYGANIDVRQFLPPPHNASTTTTASLTHSRSLLESATYSGESTATISSTKTYSTLPSHTPTTDDTKTISISQTTTNTPDSTVSESLGIQRKPHSRTETINISSYINHVPKKSFALPETAVIATNAVTQVTSAFSGSGPNILSAQKTALIGNIIRCQDSDQEFHAEPMSWPDSIWQLSIGNTELRYVLGALVGTWGSRALLKAGHYLAAKKWGEANIHYPAGQIFATAFFYASTTALETTIYRFGNTYERLCAFASSITQLIIAGSYLYYFHPANFEAETTSIKKSPWIYQKIQSVITFLPESYTVNKWVDKGSRAGNHYVDKMGESFKGYREGYPRFLTADLITTSILGAISSFSMPEQQNQCYPALLATTVTQSLYTVTIIACRPFNGIPQNVFFSTIASLQTTSLIVATAQYKSPYLQNSTAAQNFVEITPIIIQATTTLISVVEVAAFVYSIYKKFKPAVSDDSLHDDNPLLEILFTSKSSDHNTPPGSIGSTAEHDLVM